jgi:hypothetical protein
MLDRRGEPPRGDGTTVRHRSEVRCKRRRHFRTGSMRDARRQRGRFFVTSDETSRT